MPGLAQQRRGKHWVLGLVQGGVLLVPSNVGVPPARSQGACTPGPLHAHSVAHVQPCTLAAASHIRGVAHLQPCVHTGLHTHSIASLQPHVLTALHTCSLVCTGLHASSLAHSQHCMLAALHACSTAWLQPCTLAASHAPSFACSGPRTLTASQSQHCTRAASHTGSLHTCSPTAFPAGSIAHAQPPPCCSGQPRASSLPALPCHGLSHFSSFKGNFILIFFLFSKIKFIRAEAVAEGGVGWLEMTLPKEKRTIKQYFPCTSPSPFLLPRIPREGNWGFFANPGQQLIISAVVLHAL